MAQVAQPDAAPGQRFIRWRRGFSEMGGLASALPSEVALRAAMILLAMSFASSFIATAFGIGGGVWMAGVMASLLPPAALTPAHGLVQLGSNAGRAVTLLRHVGRAHMGGLMALNFSPAAVQIGVGCFVLRSVFAGLEGICIRRCARVRYFTNYDKPVDESARHHPLF
ncbi:MAG: hypothetical protein WD969_02700 [Paracoccaceae bacterium]